MTTREEQLEIILKQLISQHFWNRELYSTLKEGQSLYKEDFELYLQIASLIPEVLKEM